MERDVVVARADDDVETLLRTLREHELPGVPVVDDAGRCVGIVTEADLVLRDAEVELRMPHYVEIFGGIVFLEPFKHFEERLRKAFAAKVSDMMTADPITVTEDTLVEDAAKIISVRRHNRLPVVDDAGRLVGVVTRLDVLEALTE